MAQLVLEALSKEAFAPFGDVIEIEGSDWFPINNGSTQRYHKLGMVEVVGEDGLPAISMARGAAFDFPLSISMLERHPLGSQSFIPCNGVPFIVVVAPSLPNGLPDESGLRAFHAYSDQGVNYRRGCWHHPLISLGREGDFIVVDRVGSGHNCDEFALSTSYRIEAAS
ncbi:MULTISPECIES: ureidoglycolate lyase [Aquitalea]|uniref:Ureidoglycolate lyase n=1 Tax=Aquitalea magnusonii TaxID=332411 RepID=A0A318JSU5_9NEIS|nr:MULTISPECIES: ureidoglycolate lyase [Aquitalea]PXX43442.1 ureidoglycolate lyase [Aquitalea magnusonii]